MKAIQSLCRESERKRDGGNSGPFTRHATLPTWMKLHAGCFVAAHDLSE